MKVINLDGITSAVPYELPESCEFVVSDKPLYFRNLGNLILATDCAPEALDRLLNPTSQEESHTQAGEARTAD